MGGRVRANEGQLGRNGQCAELSFERKDERRMSALVWEMSGCKMGDLSPERLYNWHCKGVGGLHFSDTCIEGYGAV